MTSAAHITADTPAFVCAVTHPDVMAIDAQTLKDLEVFASASGGITLFDFCNNTNSRSAGQALRARMLRPFSNPERIRSVQCSLAYLARHRRIFRQLPPFMTTYNMQRYLQMSLPPLLGDNFIDFSIQVLDIIFTDTRRYDAITQGVGVTVALINALRDIVAEPELTALDACELTEILDEIGSLLKLPVIAAIPAKPSWDWNPWLNLRSDQCFRLHEKDAVARLLQLVFELDALLAMSDTTQQHGFVIPEIIDGPMSVAGEEIVHPLVSEAVPNPFRLNQEQRLLFLTGPNMAGKTTYLRSVAVALYFAHLGMGVAASSFRFVPAQQLFSSIYLVDDLHTGVSFFLAEGLRVKAIAQALAKGDKVIALMDEPFKGTNVKDAYDASLAIVQRFADRKNCLFMFSSHLIELSEQLGNMEQIDCRYFEAREDEGTLAFEYILHEGVSSQRLGMRVLKEQGIFDLLDMPDPAS